MDWSSDASKVVVLRDNKGRIVRGSEMLRDGNGRFRSSKAARPNLGHPNSGPASAGGCEGESPLNNRQSRELSALRNRATKLMGALDRLTDETAEPQKGDDRLLAKSQGVIDGFETLSQIVLRIIDKERQNLGPTESQNQAGFDGAALERRISDELDRLAARSATAQNAQADRPAG